MSILDEDPGAASVLEAFGLAPAALLGRGSEASVYALDDDRILRVPRSIGPEASAARASLLAELAASASQVPFAVPEVLETRLVCGRACTIERRLPGRVFGEVLAEAVGERRAALVRSYLEAASCIGDLLVVRPWFGELRDDEPIRASTFREYLARRAAFGLSVAGDGFERVDPVELARALPEPEAPSFVHLDAFPGNMLCNGEAITAVIDFGAAALIGDRRLEPLSAAVYLVGEEDRRTAADWLRERGLFEFFAPARRWLAAYWSHASDDEKLARWCRSVLVGD